MVHTQNWEGATFFQPQAPLADFLVQCGAISYALLFNKDKHLGHFPEIRLKPVFAFIVPDVHYAVYVTLATFLLVINSFRGTEEHPWSHELVLAK